MPQMGRARAASKFKQLFLAGLGDGSDPTGAAARAIVMIARAPSPQEPQSSRKMENPQKDTIVITQEAQLCVLDALTKLFRGIFQGKLAKYRQLPGIRFQVTFMGGGHQYLEAPLGQDRCVSELRYRVATTLPCDPWQVQLVCGTQHLRGDQLIGDIFSGTTVAEITAIVSETGGPVEDMLNSTDPMTRYVPDILQEWKQAEAACVMSASFMNEQTDINDKMRMILMDWLVEVHKKYRLRTRTLFLTFNLIDRYLQRRQVPKRKLQLVGVTCLAIAAKFEEINPPAMKDYSWLTDGAFTPREIVICEATVLTTLGFKVLTPTAAEFLLLFQKANGCNEDHRHLAQYLLELSLLDIELVCYKPSHLAAASMLLSNKLLKSHPAWPTAMQHYTGYGYKDLKPCAKILCRTLETARSSNLQAVRKKFSSSRYNQIGSRVDKLYDLVAVGQT